MKSSCSSVGQSIGFLIHPKELEPALEPPTAVVSDPVEPKPNPDAVVVLQPHARGRRLCDPKPCAECGALFQARADRAEIGRARFCSVKCANVARGRMVAKTFISPDADKKSKIRANGLINERVKRGAIVRPTQCQNCGKAKRLDSHHPDYTKPNEVVFLCRSCHCKVHHSRALEMQVAKLAFDPMDNARLVARAEVAK